MNCKNCQNHLSDTYKYCPSCAGKVVKERFSIKMLLEDATKEIFGWDNKYFVTVKYLLLKPEVLIREYLDGTRKKYVNPLTFLTIGAALSVLFFNIYSEEYMGMVTSLNQSNAKDAGYEIGRDIGRALRDKDENKEEIISYDSTVVDSSRIVESVGKADTSSHAFSQPENFNTAFQETILKYYNIFTYLVLPFYALLAFWVFGKPYNYAEHLVIACFLQGLSFLTGTLSFLFSVFIHPSFMSVGIIITAIIYSYAYGRLYKYAFGQVILKFLKFLLILFASGLVITIIFTLIMFLLVSMGFELPRS